MDGEEDYSRSKRRRTSGHSLDYSSRSSSPDVSDKRTLPLRRSTRDQISPSRRNQESRHQTRYSQSRSRSRDRAGGNRARNRDNSTPYRRQSRSSSRRVEEEDSSDYSPPPPVTRSRSRTRSESRRRLRSRSYSPASSPKQPSRSPSNFPPANAATLAQRQKKLKFRPCCVLPKVHARGITSTKFSPDGSLLATASADATINIYAVPSDLKTNPSPIFKLLRTLRGHLAGVNALAWSPVGPTYALASASDDKSILLWSPLSSDFPISPSPMLGHSNYVYSLAFSPKGNMLVTGSYDEAVFLWDIRSARVMRSLPAHSDPVRGVDFLRDGTMVCSCASDGLIRIWDSMTGQCLKTLVDEDRRPVTSVRFTPNGKFLVAWTLDNAVRLWRYTEGTCVKTYQGHVNSQYSLSGTIGNYFTADDVRKEEAFLVSGSEDGDVVVWDVTTKEVLWRGKGHQDVVLAVDFVRVGDPKVGTGVLVSAGKDRDVRIWVEDDGQVDLGNLTLNSRQGLGSDGDLKPTEKVVNGDVSMNEADADDMDLDD